MNIILNEEQKQILANGGVATGVDMNTYKVYKVALNDKGVMCVVISTSNPYTKVVPYTQEASSLNLTAEETKTIMQKGAGVVYRSSGAKDGDKVLTREEQIKRGVARVIEVVINLKEGTKLDHNNPLAYDWHIIKDNSNRYEEIK